MARTADTLIEQIKGEIASGVLRPGDQLEEAALASRFGVSRTPIREAVRSMVDCGLLETKPRKGAFVRLLSAKELIDLFEVAAELEGMACRLAARALTDAEAADIQQGLNACEAAADANDVGKYGAANVKFHAAIHAACGNKWLIEQLQQIQIHINAYRLMPYDLRGRLVKSVYEHREICDAILAGEGDKASEMMRDHMMMQGQRVPAIIETLSK